MAVLQERKWWHKMIAYQIYPKSFCDTNGDGIGDIAGVISRLDYLKELGVNVIWLCPVYVSPMRDNGYDISDYYNIQPEFGTLEDVRELIVQAKNRGIKVLMDLVVNHCSSEHPWFLKAMAEPLGEYGKFFIIKEGKDGKPPTNWRSIFGGNVWEPIEETGLYYYHTFAREQPDLNWEHPTLRREIYDMMNYWLAMGLGGFRVDAITYLKKDPAFPCLSPDGPDGLANLQEVSENYPGIEVFLSEMRRETFDRYDAFSVAEMSGVKNEKMAEYFGDDGLFSSIFDFSYLDLDTIDGLWYRQNKMTATQVKAELFPSQRMAEDIGSFLSVVLENHDQPRSLDKWFSKENICYESTTMLAVLNLTLRGLPFLYQGEEIGMSGRNWSSMEEFNDICTHSQYERALEEGYSVEEAFHAVNCRSRDQSRTPMQWDDSANAGFTTGTPWLPVNEDYPAVNVKRQQADEQSVLRFYEEMIRLRKDLRYKELFIYGTLTPRYEEIPELIAYERRLGEAGILILLNYSDAPTKVPISEIGSIMIHNYRDMEQDEADAGNVVLRAYEAIVMDLHR